MYTPVAISRRSSTIEASSAKTVEGRTILFVPKASMYVKTPPKSPAFFNHHMNLGRDISILLYKVAARTAPRPVAMADALAGIGARGIRVAVEVPEVDKVHINDLNPTAIEYGKASAAINNVSRRCQFTVTDASRFLIEHSSPCERFHIVDVDPFGTPAPYLDCAVRAVRTGGWLSVTATDTPVLCGIYPSVAFRRYHGYSLKTEYCHEVGIRLVLGALAHIVMKIDMGLIPIFAHNTRHYIRVYVKLVRSVRKAEEARNSLGYIGHCFACGYRSVEIQIATRCISCGTPLGIAGPLWINSIYDKTIVRELLGLCNERIRKIFERALAELEMPPTYYLPDQIADDLQTASGSPDDLVQALRYEGYRASRTAINPSGIKTDAPLPVLKDLIQRRSLRLVRQGHCLPK